MKIYLFLLFLLPIAAFAQEKTAVMPSSIANNDEQIAQVQVNAPLIKIQNGSFEPQNVATGVRSYGTAYGAQNKELRILTKPNAVRSERVAEWASCGFAQTSPFDIQPGHHNCETKPYDGIRYLGMVTRADGTFEWASQGLTSPLLKGKTYQILLYVAQANEYVSPTKDDDHFLDFDTPCRLQIVGTNSECNGYETLAETEGITSKQWQKIIVRFTPSKNYSHLQIQARYSTKTPARGNLLVDNVSDILPLDSVKWQPTIALPSTDTTEIADKMAAEISIAEAVRSLKINQTHYSLPQEWFLQRGKLQFGNLAFANIIRAASKIPNSKLVIHLKTGAFDDWEEWQTLLYRYCKNNYNLDENRIIIKYYKRADRKAKWISDTEMFAIRLE